MFHAHKAEPFKKKATQRAERGSRHAEATCILILVYAGGLSRDPRQEDGRGGEKAAEGQC